MQELTSQGLYKRGKFGHIRTHYLTKNNILPRASFRKTQRPGSTTSYDISLTLPKQAGGALVWIRLLIFIVNQFSQGGEQEKEKSN